MMKRYAPGKMERSTSECLGVVGYLVFFLILGFLGLLMASQGLEVWKNSGFAMGKYSVSEGVASARFMVEVGSAGFLFGSFGVVWMLWLKLCAKRRHK